MHKHNSVYFELRGKNKTDDIAESDSNTSVVCKNIYNIRQALQVDRHDFWKIKVKVSVIVHRRLLKSQFSCNL